MIKKAAAVVVLSLAAQIVGGYMALAGLVFGGILVFGAPIAATFYLAQTYRASKGTKKQGNKKARIAICVSIVIVIGALPALLLGEVLSARVASWRLEAYQKRLLQKDEEWRTQQRHTVCVTADNVTYDFEFAGIYDKYESAYFAVRDNAPQTVRIQAAGVIDNQITHAYALCAKGQISPLAEREQLKAAFDDFLQLAAPYYK